MSKAISEEVLDQIMSLARSYPKDQGITVEALMSSHGFTDSGQVHAALDELERRGLLASRPLIYYTGPDEGTKQ